MTETCAHPIDREISRLKLKTRLVSFAREIGFDSCRVAACSSPPHANEFRRWLRDEAHGEMSYMERGEEKRCDPQKVLPGARSIIVLALNYFQEARPTRLRKASVCKQLRGYSKDWENRAICLGR